MGEGDGIPGRGLGVSRNGRPEFVPYVYRGTGEDIYKPGGRMRRRKPKVVNGRCQRCGYLVTAEGHKAECGQRG